MPRQREVDINTTVLPKGRKEGGTVKRTKRAVALIAMLTLVAVSVTAATVSAGNSKSSKSLAGGTYRVGWESSFGFTGGFDPTGEYLGEAWAVLSNLLTRSLVGYNHVAGAAGNKLVPDLATSFRSRRMVARRTASR